MNEYSLYSFLRKWQKKWGCTPTVQKYGQNLERNGYEFLRCRLPIFIQSDIESNIALRDTDKSLEGTAKDLVYLQKDRLDESNETEIAIPDTYHNLPNDPNQLKEFLLFLVNELAATREMNVQLTNDMSQLKNEQKPLRNITSIRKRFLNGFFRIFYGVNNNLNRGNQINSRNSFVPTIQNHYFSNFNNFPRNIYKF
jgi:hypothetical protein